MQSHIDTSTVPRRSAGVRQTELEDALMLRSADGETGCSLNGSAAAIWHLCDGRRDPAEIASVLAGELGCEPGDLARDVASTLSQLARLGLIVLEAKESSD